jgi:predicted dehydrogenase
MGLPEGNTNRKKIGIIGLGSIGLRHVQAIKAIGIDQIFHYKTGKGNKLIPKDLESQIIVVDNIEEFRKVDCIIISNPTSLHGKAVKEVVSLKKPIFVEKPLSDTYVEDNELQMLLEDYPAKIQLGFCLRFHPIILKVKEILNNETLGDIYFSRLDVGQYLPTWHPYTDYSQEYFSIKKLGGGAIRTLSHEIDLAIFFFGKPLSVKGQVSKVSNLNIDVDDYSSALLKYQSIMVNLNIDFLSRKPHRKGVIMGKKADLYYDIFSKEIFIIDNDGKQTNYTIEDKDMYVEQMRSFVFNTDANYANLTDSKILSEIIKQVEENSKTNIWNAI